MRKMSPGHFRLLSYKAPLRGALVIGAASDAALAERLRPVQKAAERAAHRRRARLRSRICALPSAW